MKLSHLFVARAVAGADTATPGQLSPNEPKRTNARSSVGARGARRGVDARGAPERQRENQRRLDVGADHRTPAMKKGHRGTYP
jgi:hypothetical protein